MENGYRAYLKLLNTLGGHVEKLTALAERKAEAARNDDLNIINEVINQEQAQALAFRGLEQSKEKLSKELGLGDVPLSQLAGHFPPELREEAAKAASALKEKYRAYQKSAGDARAVLEQTRQEVESLIIAMGGAAAKAAADAASGAGPGYVPPAPRPEPPKIMKTDFRA